MMFTKARKIQLIEDMLKVSNEATLNELETVLKKSGKRKKKNILPGNFQVYGVKRMQR